MQLNSLCAPFRCDCAVWQRDWCSGWPLVEIGGVSGASHQSDTLVNPSCSQPLLAFVCPVSVAVRWDLIPTQSDTVLYGHNVHMVLDVTVCVCVCVCTFDLDPRIPVTAWTLIFPPVCILQGHTGACSWQTPPCPCPYLEGDDLGGMAHHHTPAGAPRCLPNCFVRAATVRPLDSELAELLVQVVCRPGRIAETFL